MVCSLTKSLNRVVHNCLMLDDGEYLPSLGDENNDNVRKAINVT